MKPYRFCRGIRTALLASALAGSLLASCNFGMPLPNYTVMRQGRNYTLLASYRIALDQSLPEARFGFAILDGASAANGSTVPHAYLGLEARDWGKPKGLMLEGQRVDSLEIPMGVLSSRQVCYSQQAGFFQYTTAGAVPLFVSFDGSRYSLTPGTELPFTGMLFGANPFSAFTFRKIVNTAGTISVEYGNSIGDSMTPIGAATGLLTDIASSFTVLTDAAYPGTSFWNTGAAEIQRMGFSESGAFTWLVAMRRDELKEIEEKRLVTIADGGGLRTTGLEVAGTAGSHVLAWTERDAPLFELAALDASLAERGRIRLYGRDAAYLGEARAPYDGDLKNCALFAVLNASSSWFGGDSALTIAVYAYPVDSLEGAKP